MFDDSLLDDPVALTVRGERVHRLALTGARLRCDYSEDMAEIVATVGGLQPRSILVIGTEARLIRAIVECGSPVPCVAWQKQTLPSWTGPLDMVIVLAGPDSRWLPLCREAARRGAMVFMVAPRNSKALIEPTAIPTIITQDDDPFLAAVLALKVVDLLAVGPALDVNLVADTLDAVAETCGPRHGLETNPAKNLSCALADVIPLVWGSSTLAARASRRVAEALREAAALPALAGDDAALAPLIESAHPHDVFADPFEEASLKTKYCVLVLDDGESSVYGSDLVHMAHSHNIRVERIAFTHENPLVRYSGLLYPGLYAAAYLGLATMAE